MWVGGLGYFVIALFPAFRIAGLSREDRRAFLAACVPRFSRLAVGSVLALFVTGTYNLAVQSTDLGAIFRSGYGQVLIIKHVLLIALVALGAVNLLRLSPQLRKRPAQPEANADTVIESRPDSALRRNVRTELALAAAVLVCAGGLTLLPPPSGPGSTYAAGTEAAQPTPLPIALATSPPAVTPGPAYASTSSSGYNLALETVPSIEGDELTLTVTKALTSSPALTDVSKVLFKVTPQDVDASSASYVATPAAGAADGVSVWTTREQFLTLDGTYLVTTIIERNRLPDLKAAFRLNLSETAGLTAGASPVVEAQVSTDPSPPISGTATLKIKVLDGEGKPVEGAKVVVNPLMPSHAHQEPVGTAQPVAGQPGLYSMPVDFKMGGAWLLIITVERAGYPTVKTDASLDVIDPNATPTP
jgi:uncharacterized membrane protein